MHKQAMLSLALSMLPAATVAAPLQDASKFTERIKTSIETHLQKTRQAHLEAQAS